MNNTMISQKKIIVVGSTNTDMVVKTDRFPLPGETVLGGKFFMNLGGKGANQAVAAARLSADVQFISCVGDDIFGQQAIHQLAKENIDVSAVSIDALENSGVALITVDKHAENNIVVASGANSKLDFDNNQGLKDAITADSIVLMQLEIPLTTVEQVAVYAKEVGATVVLNPAPASALSKTILEAIAIITPNQKEAQGLSGIEVTDLATAALAAKKIRDMGPPVVVITLGKLGSYLYSDEESIFMPSYKVIAEDTTAAGDVFNGGFVVGLSRGFTSEEAMRLGAKAAAIAVTRIGAQASAPTMAELALFVGQQL